MLQVVSVRAPARLALAASLPHVHSVSGINPNKNTQDTISGNERCFSYRLLKAYELSLPFASVMP